jgi:serine phosphatase RsbU (regulator of sigma subunit)
MATPKPSTPPLWTTLVDSVHETRADMPRGWRAHLRQTADDLDAFYLAQEQRHALTTKNHVWRWFVRAWWLLKALFFRLSPVRRVVFIIAVVLVVGSKDVSGSGTGIAFNANAALVGAALLVVLLMLELKDKLLARHELQAGRAVQQALMPGAAPAVSGWDVWLYTRPANDVGGDLVDALGSGTHTRLVLADVAGKALPAALLMAKVQATLRALVTEVPSLAALAERTNTILCRDGLPNRFATMVYLDIQAESGRVSLVNAGHQPPIVVSGGRFHELQPGGMALGMMPGSTYAEQDIDLQPGEALVIYSDGVTEAMNDAGEFFGDDRLRVLLSDPRPITAEQYGRRLLAAVDTFMGDTRPYDDLSLIVAKRSAGAS